MIHLSYSSLSLSLGLFLVCLNLSAQETITEIKVSTFDLRAETPKRAVVSALHASKNKAIIVMTRGADQNLIDQVKADLEVLIRNGCKRIVLVLAQSFPEEHKPFICIYADGRPYALLKNVEKNAQTSVDLYRMVQESYQSFVLSEN